MKIINVIASSIDGRISSKEHETDAERSKYELTSKADQDHVRQLISDADAIITGAESVRSSGALRKDRNTSGQFPLWIVMTTKGLDKKLEFWSQAEHERWIVSPAPVPVHDPKVRSLVCGKTHPATFIVQELKARKTKKVLLFGGGAANALFYQAGLVDELHLTLSPVIVGSSGAADFLNTKYATLAQPQTLQLKNSVVKNDHVFLHYIVNKK